MQYQLLLIMAFVLISLLPCSFSVADDLPDHITGKRTLCKKTICFKLMLTLISVEEGLDEIIDLMETLLKDYSNQDKQLNRIHGKLSVVKHGYNSLKRELSTVECSMSGAIGESSNAAVCLDEHKEQTASDLCDIETCINDAQQTLDTIEDFVQCGGGDWRLAILQDYSNPNTNCPGRWRPVIRSGQRFCTRSEFIDVGTCESVSFRVDGEYSRVCGRIRAFHAGQATSFRPPISIEAAYLTGLSLTHGRPRQHIWSFAIGESEDSNDLILGLRGLCPCHNDALPGSVPPFVGNDYFCEAALDRPFRGGTWHNR